jgi:hypothetical protein
LIEFIKKLNKKNIYKKVAIFLYYQYISSAFFGRKQQFIDIPNKII